MGNAATCSTPKAGIQGFDAYGVAVEFYCLLHGLMTCRASLHRSTHHLVKFLGVQTKITNLRLRLRFLHGGECMTWSEPIQDLENPPVASGPDRCLDLLHEHPKFTIERCRHAS